MTYLQSIGDPSSCDGGEVLLFREHLIREKGTSKATAYLAERDRTLFSMVPKLYRMLIAEILRSWAGVGAETT